MFGGVGGAVDGDLARPIEVAVPGHDGDASLLLGGANTTNEGRNHLVLPLLQRRPVEADAVGLHTELGAVDGVIVGLGGPKEGLGGDAADVEARPPQGNGLHEQHLLPAVAEPLSGDVSAGPAAQHDDVKVGHDRLLSAQNGDLDVLDEGHQVLQEAGGVGAVDDPVVGGQ